MAILPPLSYSRLTLCLFCPVCDRLSPLGPSEIPTAKQNAHPYTTGTSRSRAAPRMTLLGSYAGCRWSTKPWPTSPQQHPGIADAETMRPSTDCLFRKRFGMLFLALPRSRLSSWGDQTSLSNAKTSSRASGPATRSRVLSHSSSQRPTSECVRFQPVGSGERRVHVHATTVTALAPPPGTLVLLRGAFRIGSSWGRAKRQSRYFGCVCPTLAPSQIPPRGISDRTWNESGASLLGSSRCYNQQRSNSPTAHFQRACEIKSG